MTRKHALRTGLGALLAALVLAAVAGRSDGGSGSAASWKPQQHAAPRAHWNQGPPRRAV